MRVAGKGILSHASVTSHDFPSDFGPVDAPPLGVGCVHLWGVEWYRTVADADLAPLTRVERARAERYRMARPRLQFLNARLRLRHVLAAYLGCDAGAVALEQPPLGKPRLAEPFAQAGIDFNVTHTDGGVLIAVGRSVRVGVDLERVRPIDADGLTRRFFSADEWREWAALPEPRPLATFFRAWTLKEAVVKCVGASAQEFALFSVSLHADALTQDVPTEWLSGLPAGWHLAAQEWSPGVWGALAARGL